MKNKYGNWILAFLIAFGMWFYVVTQVSTSQTNEYYNVPVVLEGESVLVDRGLMLVSDPEVSVRVDLTANRQVLSKINASNMTLKADLSDIREAGTYRLEYSIDYPGDVPVGEVKVQLRSPDRVAVEVAKRDSKDVPVQVVYMGDTPADYMIDKVNATIDYEFVTVSGPQEVVELIADAAIVVDCEGRTESISESYRYVLRDAEGNAVDAATITTNVAEIRLDVRIVRVKEIPLVLAVVDGGGATADTTRIEIEPKTITVSGSDAALAELEQITLGTINLANVPEETERVFSIQLPEGITNLGEDTEALVRISFPDLATREFTITNIRTLNVPDGMVAQVLTKQLTVVVRGPKDYVSALQLGQIETQIDLSGVEGTAALEPVITFPEEYPGLGIVGRYSVNVTVAPEPEPTTEE